MLVSEYTKDEALAFIESMRLTVAGSIDGVNARSDYESFIATNEDG